MQSGYYVATYSIYNILISEDDSEENFDESEDDEFDDDEFDDDEFDDDEEDYDDEDGEDEDELEENEERGMFRRSAWSNAYDEGIYTCIHIIIF